ncbi:uncharacterized protein LOC119402696 [Rhipicephalus sanguineus]|uniref:uncharacterized protein LOC119402696 n=1 Tax=Rhipicephalus sanguineus TaxID=34632 RepID=UPI0018956AB0|nr:uncharacterized protein LOC119402696 [Rhipicephalus sanguineus]
MKQFTKIFVSFFMLGFAGITFTNIVAEGSNDVRLEASNNAGTQINRTQEWWKLAPPTRRDEPIGQNVSLKAYVFYDSEYEAHSKQKENAEITNDQNEPPVGPMKGYFDSLFQQVQEYFNNQSIMINITVTNVTKKKFPMENSDSLSDMNSTLESLIKHGETLKQPPNTVFYYFTRSSNNADSNGNANLKGLGHPDAHQQTNGTFCSTNTSGAVIRHRHGSGIHWTTSTATLFVFGSKHFIYITEEDWSNMNQTFLKCPIGNGPLPPAC